MIAKDSITTMISEDNDPLIRIDLACPAKVTVPSSEGQGVTYLGSVTMVNTSKFPLSNSKVQLTMKDTLMGYSAGLLDGVGKTSLLSFDLGTIPPGPDGKVTMMFKFRIDQVVAHPPPVSGDAHVQLNVLPEYEIQYSKVDGFQSTAQVLVDVSSAPGVTDLKTDTFDTDPVITVKHTYWGVFYNNSVTPNGYVQGDITIENKARLPLNDVQLQFTLDDDAARYTAIVVDNNSNPLTQTMFDLGSLAPNNQPVDERYWWAIQLIAGTVPQKEDFNVNFNIMPWYKVAYQRNDDTFKFHIPATQS